MLFESFGGKREWSNFPLSGSGQEWKENIVLYIKEGKLDSIATSFESNGDCLTSAKL